VMGGLFSFRSSWLELALALYILVAIVGIVVYAPTLRRQIALAEADPSSAEYAAVARRSNILGIATIAIVVVIVALMVFKPALWG
jgi:uncharacterized membrane protein